MTYAFARKITKQTLRTAHVAVICAMLVYSQVAPAVEITLGANMNVRTQNDDGLSVAGVLGKGSVVEIPDRYIVRNANGKVDADKTFSKWLHSAGYTNPQINRKTSGTQDFFFPVKIKSVAGNPNSKLMKSKKQLFMALRVLERTSGGLRVKENARAYNPSGLKPMHGLKNPRVANSTARPAPKARSIVEPSTSQPSKPGPVKIEPAPERTAPTPRVATPPVPVPQTELQDSQPPATDDQSNSEAQDPNNCPTCGTREPSPSDSAVDTATDVADAATDAVSNGSVGLPALSRDFPKTCESFIQQDGSYGTFGKAALKELMRHSAFTSPWSSESSAAIKACPNFNSFKTDEEKLHFWVYVLAATAARESNCSLDATSPASINPNGVAVGLYQIEQRADLRAGRDAAWGGTYCSGSDPYALGLNTRCAVKMLEDVADDSQGPYKTGRNYWSSLIKPGAVTHTLISDYGPCGNTHVEPTLAKDIKRLAEWRRANGVSSGGSARSGSRTHKKSHVTKYKSRRRK